MAMGLCDEDSDGPLVTDKGYCISNNEHLRRPLPIVVHLLEISENFEDGSVSSDDGIGDVSGDDGGDSDSNEGDGFGICGDSNGDNVNGDSTNGDGDGDSSESDSSGVSGGSDGDNVNGDRLGDGFSGNDNSGGVNGDDNNGAVNDVSGGTGISGDSGVNGGGGIGGVGNVSDVAVNDGNNYYDYEGGGEALAVQDEVSSEQYRYYVYQENLLRSGYGYVNGYAERDFSYYAGNDDGHRKRNTTNRLKLNIEIPISESFRRNMTNLIGRGPTPGSICPPINGDLHYIDLAMPLRYIRSLLASRGIINHGRGSGCQVGRGTGRGKGDGARDRGSRGNRAKDSGSRGGGIRGGGIRGGGRSGFSSGDSDFEYGDEAHSRKSNGESPRMNLLYVNDTSDAEDDKEHPPATINTADVLNTDVDMANIEMIVVVDSGTSPANEEKQEQVPTRDQQQNENDDGCCLFCLEICGCTVM